MNLYNVLFFIFLLILSGVECGCGGAHKSGVYAYSKPERMVLIQNDNSQDLMCVEPPVPAILTHRMDAEAQVQVGKAVNIEGSGDYDESLHQIYQLNNENLLMQYAMYRLCEMMVNLRALKSDSNWNEFAKIYQDHFQSIFDAVKSLLEAKTREVKTEELTIHYKLLRLKMDNLSGQIRVLKQLAATASEEQKTSFEQQLQEALLEMKQIVRNVNDLQQSEAPEEQ